MLITRLNEQSWSILRKWTQRNARVFKSNLQNRNHTNDGVELIQGSFPTAAKLGFNN